MKFLITAVFVGILAAISTPPAFAWSARLVKDILPGEESSSPDKFVPVGETMFFQAKGLPNNFQFWKTDGTEAGTSLVKDIFPSSYFEIYTAVESNGLLYIIASPNNSDYALWKSDGTEAGTVQIKNLGSGMWPFGIFAANARIYFFFNLPPSGGAATSQLWTSDGTEEGTILLRSFLTPFVGADIFCQFNDVVYFGASNGPQTGLWRTDGTTEGTFFVTSIPGDFPFLPQNFISMPGTLYFLGGDDSGGYSLYKTNGTSGGTDILAQVTTASRNPDYSSLEPDFHFLKLAVAVSDTIIFAQRTDDGNYIYRTDGTVAGTEMIQSLADESPYHVENLPSGILVFTNATTSYDRGLWRTDGTTQGTTKIKAWSGLTTDCHTFFTSCVSGNLIFFTLDDCEHGGEPWCSDGTSEGTFLVADIYPGTTGSGITLLKTVGTGVLMNANDGVHGDELWVAGNTPPTAAFSAAPPLDGDPPLDVQFIDESVPGSTPITAWLWNFGDGETSADQNPSHVYDEIGVYSVTLTVTTADGADFLQRHRYIYVGADLPAAGIIALILTATLIAAARSRRFRRA